jgi:cell division transport system permease protein
VKFFRLFGYAALNALRNLRSGWKLHLLTISTVAAMFLVFSGGMLLFVNVRGIFLGSRGETEMTAYLKEGPEPAGRAEIEGKFCREPFVRRCEFLSSVDARRQFVTANPDLASAVSTLDGNPFPASVRIQIDPKFRDTERLREFSGRISALPQVEGMEEGGEWLVHWMRLLNLVDALFIAVAIALGAAAIFVVSNTIRILVHSKRDEIEILSLVGATDRTIRAPFLLEGTVQGGVGALAAILLLRVGFEYARWHVAYHFTGLLPGEFVFLPVRIQVGAVLAGGGLGFLGSAFAVGRFFRS